MKQHTIASLILSALLATACARGLSPEEARLELVKLKLEYNINTFVDRAGASDPVAVKLFLAAGMNPNSRNSDGITAIDAATKGGDLAIVQALVDRGATVNGGSDRDGNNVVIAAGDGHTQIAELLLDHLIAQKPSEAGRLTTDAFHSACVGDQEATAKTFYARLSKVLSKQDLLKAVEIGFRCVTFYGKSAGLAEFLLENGAHIDTQSNVDGYTPLHDAAKNGSIEMVRALIKRGANPYLKDYQGKTAADVADENYHSDVSRILVEVMQKRGKVITHDRFSKYVRKESSNGSSKDQKPWDLPWKENKSSK